MKYSTKVPITKAKLTGFALFAFSCVALVVALTLPFLSLPFSTGVKAGLITGLIVAGEVAFAASLTFLGKEYADKLKQYVSFMTIPSARFFLASGVGVWLLATATIRLVGQHVFIPGNTTRIVVAFVVLIAAMVLLMTALFRWKRLEEKDQVVAGALFAIPGLLLDAIVVYFFPVVYPNLSPQADNLLAGWLFCGYGTALLISLVHFRRPESISHGPNPGGKN